MTDDERREAYRDAIHGADTLRADPLSRDYLRADAAMTVADEELEKVAHSLAAERMRRVFAQGTADRLRTELDYTQSQYHGVMDTIGRICNVLDDLERSDDAYSGIAAQVRQAMEGESND
jgi:hypothetical protein